MQLGPGTAALYAIAGMIVSLASIGADAVNQPELETGLSPATPHAGAGNVGTKVDVDALRELQLALTAEARSHAEFLTGQAVHHREFLERSYSVVGWVLGLAGVAFGGTMTWLSWKTKHDVQASVKDHFDRHIKGEAAVQQAELFADLDRLNAEVRATNARNLLISALDRLEAASPLSDPFLSILIKESRREAETCLKFRTTSERARQVGLLLGRLLRATDGYDAAIKAITRFEDTWQIFRREDDSHLAALLFNRACYRNCRADELAKLESPEENMSAERLRCEAWEDLQKACQLDPDNLQELDDLDLKSLFQAPSRTKESIRMDCNRSAAAGGRKRRKGAIK